MKNEMNNPIVEVFSGSLWEAELVKGLLEANKIQSMLKDENLSVVTSAYSNIGGGVKVLVNREDEETAKEIIAERGQAEMPEE